MKYVLNKDLPTFKAGILATFHNWIFKSEDWKIITHFSATDLATHPKIFTEWFTPTEEKRKAVPDDWESYCRINTDGSTSIITDLNPYNWQVNNQGNWRWTQEEAELEVKKRAAIERVRRYLVRNDLLEEDKEKSYIIIYLNKWNIDFSSYWIHNRYSPYGRIKNTDLTQFVRDCRADLILIHS